MPTDPISITHISLSENPAPFLSNIRFNFTFQANKPLTSPLAWKIVYVGSAKDESYDQILEEFEIESFDQESAMKFSVECPPPDYKKIPKKQLLCLTAIIITVSYKQQQFIRIGYYVHTTTSKQLGAGLYANSSTEQLVNHLTRTILIDKPRITKFKIVSDKKESSKLEEKTDGSPVKRQKIDHSNSILSVSKTSCNEKQSSEADLTPFSKFSQKKQKKIKKQSRLPPL